MTAPGVHPRVCGGNPPSQGRRKAQRGPSPRVRGKQNRSGTPVDVGGSIPACAGETDRATGGVHADRVHPRVCGGNGGTPGYAGDKAGPSPRVRGKPVREDSRRGGDRSIPACAGETGSSWGHRNRGPVHPRVCGGNVRAISERRIHTGPSPRVRGKPVVLQVERADGRSIPACAGETTCFGRTATRRRVHPRVCGGNRLTVNPDSADCGPSPRVRGKPLELETRHGLLRSIPACAGETKSSPSREGQTTVHPRVCGGNDLPTTPPQGRSGPSPRVRGKRLRPEGSELVGGSIPACAGETDLPDPLVEPVGVHPRVCGGNTALNGHPLPMYGPSPRVRGKHFETEGCAMDIRSIPACAGETRWGHEDRSRRQVHPPRVRGKPASGSGDQFRRGSIPACAGETWRGAPPRLPPGVHPRVCGGNQPSANDAMWSWGPSPRVRGKPPNSVGAGVIARSIPACAGETYSGEGVGGGGGGSIPACAGETRSRRSRASCAGVHPRVCGGNMNGAAGRPAATGPSPRVRGKRGVPELPAVAGGSIPACAGETRRPVEPPGCRWVHPRVCGGNTPRTWAMLSKMGPSPRVRGKLELQTPWQSRGGSIPACAGETPPPDAPGRAPSVHPRVCGGNNRTPGSPGRQPGPSPRVRGKQLRTTSCLTIGRSIPACAGETQACSQVHGASPVHPRVCGGNAASAPARLPHLGPSPRVRGKHADRRRLRSGPGSIPACAGETKAESVGQPTPTVHPRVCGGNPRGAASARGPSGPSPRVRGKRFVERAGAVVVGSIPACAGETRLTWTSAKSARVHPRVCGGNGYRCATARCDCGPSPRVRGKQTIA